MQKQESAIDWLVKKVIENQNLLIADIKEAKQIEKEQIIQARITAPIMDTSKNEEYLQEAQAYYQETFR
jgi:hypothetical protein